MNKVLLSVFQAGAAAAFVPVVRELRARSAEVEIHAYPHAAAAFGRMGIACETVADNRAALAVIETGVIRALLTGTSWQPEIEAELWNAARVAGIPSTAFVDNWENFPARFAVNGRAFGALPDRVAMVDEFCAEKLISAGCAASVVRVVGHPALGEITPLDDQEHRLAREQHDIPPGDWTVLFVCEAIREYAEGPNATMPHPGYTDESVIAALEAILPSRGSRLLIKPHPAQTKIPGTTHATILPSLSPRETVALADCVVGMTSILLLEAALMGVPSLSFRPSAVRESDFLKVHGGLIAQATTTNDAQKWMLASREAAPAVTNPFRGSAERLAGILLEE